MEVVQSIGAPLDAGFRELRLQEVEKRSCMVDRGLGVLQQPPAQICCSELMALFMRIGASQVGNWPCSFQSAMEVQWQLLTLWDIRRYAQDGFLKVSQPSTDDKGKPSVLNCWSILMLRGRPFCPQVVTGDETWAHRYEPETKRQSMEWHHPQSPRKKKFKTTSAGKVMITVFWDIDGVILVDVMAMGETLNSDAYIRTLQKLKQSYWRVWHNRNPGDMLIQHDNAHPHASLRTQEAIAKFGWTVLPHPPYSPDLAP
jgi:histone-lysine N-methyltransferase SETMAR